MIGDRSQQEEEADGGNISVIMLMECKDANVPIDDSLAAADRARRQQE